MTKKYSINWSDEVKETNYPSANSYLTLIFEPVKVLNLIAKLQEAEVVSFQAKDIFRASGLPILPTNNWHVTKDLRKIVDGVELSPILLIRNVEVNKVIIADGYHRLCASYHKDEDEMVKCKIVSI
jgi:hypothetical protein